MDKARIRKILSELDLPESKSNNSICSLDIIESFFVSVWIGCFKFSHTEMCELMKH